MTAEYLGESFSAKNQREASIPSLATVTLKDGGEGTQLSHAEIISPNSLPVKSRNETVLNQDFLELVRNAAEVLTDDTPLLRNEKQQVVAISQWSEFYLSISVSQRKCLTRAISKAMREINHREKKLYLLQGGNRHEFVPRALEVGDLRSLDELIGAGKIPNIPSIVFIANAFPLIPIDTQPA